MPFSAKKKRGHPQPSSDQRAGLGDPHRAAAMAWRCAAAPRRSGPRPDRFAYRSRTVEVPETTRARSTRNDQSVRACDFVPTDPVGAAICAGRRPVGAAICARHQHRSWSSSAIYVSAFMGAHCGERSSSRARARRARAYLRAVHGQARVAQLGAPRPRERHRCAPQTVFSVGLLFPPSDAKH